jgi:hypothetical protein
MDGIDLSFICWQLSWLMASISEHEKPNPSSNNGVAIMQSIASSDTSVLRGFANVQGEWE